MRPPIRTPRSAVISTTRIKVLNQLSQAQSRLATIALRGVATDAQRQSVSVLRGEIQRLEQSIGGGSLEFRVASGKVTLQGIQDPLPGGTALVEFFSYRPFRSEMPATRYSGHGGTRLYVLRWDGSRPASISGR